jgi:hypothetical protein
MSGKTGGITALKPKLFGLIPIPYGCMTMVGLVLAALATVVLSSVVIGMAILK